MRFSEMKAKQSGLPEGFSGNKAKWNEVNVAFTLVKCCMLRRPQTGQDGEILENPKTGKPYWDFQLVLEIEVEGKQYTVRTNSPRLVPLFRAQIGEDRKADYVNQYGDEVFMLDPPEGKLRFIPFRYSYKNDLKADVADLEEVTG